MKNAILSALATVQDPDLKNDLITLGMIEGLVVQDKKVDFSLVLTTPACPLKEYLKQACLQAIHQQVDSSLQVTITLTARVTSKPQSTSLPGIKNTIAIAAGKGGVGKSTVATNIAIGLARQGAKVGLLDADIFGPSIPIMFGCAEQKPSIEVQAGKKKLIPLYQYGIKLLSIGFLTNPEEAVIWRGPMASSALRQLLQDAIWGELDYLLIDCPPGTGDILLTLAQITAITGALLVTTPQKVALADVKKCITMFRHKGIAIPILGLVENMSYYQKNLIPKILDYPLGKGGGETLAASYQIPFLGKVPLLAAISIAGDEGCPIALTNNDLAYIWQKMASALAQQVAINNVKTLD